MNKETAKEVLDIHLSKMISEHPDVYDTLDEMREKPEYKVLINAMIEFAKNKCKKQREISWKLFQSSEIDGKKITLDAKTPDFK